MGISSPRYAITSRNGEGIIDFKHDIIEQDIAGVNVVEFKEISDSRGSLFFGEFGKQIPFEVKRFFSIYNVLSGESRGNHAHKECKQSIMCFSGKVDIVCDNGITRAKYHLNKKNKCINLESKIWTSLYNFSDDAVVVVFASDYYEEADYLRDYEDFLNYIKNDS